MIDRAGALALIEQCLESLNRERQPDERIPISADLPLLGDGSALDSLAFVSFTSDLEDRMRMRTGRSLMLISRGLESPDEPFRSVSALADFIVSLSA